MRPAPGGVSGGLCPPGPGVWGPMAPGGRDKSLLPCGRRPLGMFRVAAHPLCVVTPQPGAPSARRASQSSSRLAPRVFTVNGVAQPHRANRGEAPRRLLSMLRVAAHPLCAVTPQPGAPSARRASQSSSRLAPRVFTVNGVAQPNRVSAAGTARLTPRGSRWDRAGTQAGCRQCPSHPDT